MTRGKSRRTHAQESSPYSAIPQPTRYMYTGFFDFWIALAKSRPRVGPCLLFWGGVTIIKGVSNRY